MITERWEKTFNMEIPKIKSSATLEIDFQYYKYQTRGWLIDTSTITNNKYLIITISTYIEITKTIDNTKLILSD
jgi:hypothetical protein